MGGVLAGGGAWGDGGEPGRTPHPSPRGRARARPGRLLLRLLVVGGLPIQGEPRVRSLLQQLCPLLLQLSGWGREGRSGPGPARPPPAHPLPGSSPSSSCIFLRSSAPTRDTRLGGPSAWGTRTSSSKYFCRSRKVSCSGEAAGPGAGGWGERALRPGPSGCAPAGAHSRAGWAPPAYLGRAVVGRVWAGHGGEGPVGLLHAGGQLVRRRRGGGLAGRARVSYAGTAVPAAATTHPATSCPRVPQIPTPHGAGHSHSGDHLPWGPGSPLARPEPVAGSPRVLSAEGRGRVQREGSVVQVRGSGEREREGAKMGGRDGCPERGPTLTRLPRRGRGWELGTVGAYPQWQCSKWRCSWPHPPHAAEPGNLGRQDVGGCAEPAPRDSQTRDGQR